MGMCSIRPVQRAAARLHSCVCSEEFRTSGVITDKFSMFGVCYTRSFAVSRDIGVPVH